MASATFPSIAEFKPPKRTPDSAWVAHAISKHGQIPATTGIVLSLNGAATRIAHQDAPLREAVAQLQVMAGGKPWACIVQSIGKAAESDWGSLVTSMNTASFRHS
ncbi:MAG: hypothetical protein QOH21_3100 [Acidobacteriota bacterium]|jgi:hypothetical protein|nr:hypothetical protein [Acidobacteriota bacterium]